VNFGPLAAEIVSLVWGTPGNFNGFRVLAALLHGTLVVGVIQTSALNRGRPSRWALAHISSVLVLHVVLQYFSVHIFAILVAVLFWTESHTKTHFATT